MSNADLVARERARESGVFPKRSVAILRGLGAQFWDAEGRAYLDMGANYGVANVGHCHPRVVRAIEEQARALVHIPQTYANDRRAELMERLVGIAPPGLDRVFLGNSGTEAVEAALKFARAHTGRTGLVAAKRGFHGRTMGALALTFKPEYRDPFAPLLPGGQHVSYGDVEALKQAVSRDTAALFLEPIQGEGGAIVPPAGYLRAARDICTDAGALLVLDEIQTGLGRTGRMWAVEHEGIAPDILCFAKGIAGGLPMGGLLLRSEVCTLPVASHGNTFGGNPVACGAAIAVLDVLRDEQLPARAERMGTRLLAGLRSLPGAHVREARGRGLMVGLELRSKNTPVLNALIALGVLALPTGSTVLRYLPPLVVSEAQVDEAVSATAKALEVAHAA
ncbi:MAG: aspartate aminotransferase family protein [Halobacteriales archaeon]|nr:aspartate aminotransferase family protein [Halobacteriales archaeon]